MLFWNIYVQYPIINFKRCTRSVHVLQEIIFVHVTDIFYRVTKNMAASQVIRKLFPRPSFVPPESEVALEKVVFIDGYKSDHYELVSGVVFY